MRWMTAHRHGTRIRPLPSSLAARPLTRIRQCLHSLPLLGSRGTYLPHALSVSLAAPTCPPLPPVSYIRHRSLRRAHALPKCKIMCRPEFPDRGLFVQPNATAQTIMRMLRKISGTVNVVSMAVTARLWHVACLLQYGDSSLLRMSVRTELMRFMVFAFMLAPSCAPPKEGSFCAAFPQPTVHVVSSVVSYKACS